MTAGRLGKPLECGGCHWGTSAGAEESIQRGLCSRAVWHSTAQRDLYCPVSQGKSQCRSESIDILAPKSGHLQVRRCIHILSYSPGSPEDQ